MLGQFLQRAGADPMLGGVQTLWRAAVPQLYVDVDREKAKALGVPVNDVFDTLAATLGNYYVNDFNRFGRTWQVLMSADPAYRKRPEAIGDLFVRTGRGDMVPLRSLADVRYTAGPDSLDRFNNLPSVKIFGQGAPGISSGQAIAAVERIANQVGWGKTVGMVASLISVDMFEAARIRRTVAKGGDKHTVFRVGEHDG